MSCTVIRLNRRNSRAKDNLTKAYGSLSIYSFGKGTNYEGFSNLGGKLHPCDGV